MVSRPWGGHGRVVWQTRARTRGAHVWAARTLPPDNFAKLRRAMKVARTSPSGEWEIGGDRGRGRRGIVVSLFSNRISMSEWVSIDRMYVRRCVALTRRDHSERKTTKSTPTDTRPKGLRPSARSLIVIVRFARESECELHEWLRTLDVPSNFVGTWKFYGEWMHRREWLM